MAKIHAETGDVQGGIDQFEDKLRQTGVQPYVVHDEDSDEELKELGRTAKATQKHATGFS